MNERLVAGMNVVVALEHRFLRTPDGAIWTQAMFAYPFWCRYLSVFERVTIVARAKTVLRAPPGWLRADGEGVDIAPVPYYVGPWQFLLRTRQVRRAVRRAVARTDAVILRVESQVANVMEGQLRHTGQPYGVEVTGDPYDGFAPGSVRSVTRPFMRWWFPRQVRRQCAGACAAAYVTAHALQRRYPPARGAYTTHYSSIELPDTAFVRTPRPAPAPGKRVRLITVGTLEQLYKAPDVLINAVARCVREGMDLDLTLIGDGKHRTELKRLASTLGLGERVRFAGQLTAGSSVRAQLDQADLFVLPSHQEGLPRATIEAMARGLPCIGSTVGGFAELLPEENLVPPGDVVALARKIWEVVGDGERMQRMGAQNLVRAQAYRDEVLNARRKEFYAQVRAATRAWSGPNMT